jgi:asparagine synthase (glutamine-hydrolysing)
MKPLYFTFDAKAQLFLFASEIKAILRYPRFIPRLDTQTLADMLVLSYPVGDRTFFEGVHSLRPGHIMIISCDNGLHVGDPTPYHARGNIIRRNDVDFEEALERLEMALTRAVETHLAADVDVGLTLSGGIDSTLLALFATQQRQQPLSTFSVADHEGHPDVVQGRQVAEMVGSRHQAIIVSFEDYLETIPNLVAGEEQPGSLYGVPFYFLCRRIAERVRSCLHGEGADELFGGYREYLDRNSRITYIVRRLPLLKRLGVAPSPSALETIRQLSGTGSFETYLRRVFDVNMGDALERQHLVPVDKSAMAASLEIRVPYLDDAVVELVGQLPLRYLVRHDLGIRKYILRRLVLTRFGLGCTDVVLREKLGAPAAGVALLDRFDRLCEEELPDAYVAGHEFGGCFDSKRELIMFDMFLEVFMKHRGDATAIGSVMEFMKERAGERAALRYRRRGTFTPTEDLQ